MALWPPSLINYDKSSLSAGAFKACLCRQAGIRYALRHEDKNSHEKERVESTSVSWRPISGMFCRHLADG